MYQLIQDDAWFLSSRCPEALSAIPALEYDSDKGGEDVLKTDHVYDDIGDELRYGLVDVVNVAKKPHDVKVAEEIDSAADDFQRHLIRMRETHRREKKMHAGPWWV